MENLEYQKYIEKIKLLEKYSYFYYTESSSLVSDEEYDLLYREIKEFESKNPDLISKNSLTQKVGTDQINELFKEKHLSRMWSLDNLFSIEESLEWFDKVSGNEEKTQEAELDNLFALEDEETDFALFCEPKLDGASLNLIYENGILIKAITRGNGEVGENVTEQAKTIQFIPLEIPHQNRIEIRGEVVISKKQFKFINEVQKKFKLEPFANERNLASGSLRQQNTQITQERKLIFFPHGIGENSLNFKTYSEIFKFFSENGFKEIFESKKVTNKQELENYLKELSEKRDSLNFVIDGAVLKIDDLEIHKKLGYTSKFPKWANAFKFPSDKSITKLVDIEWQVGRTGVLTPVAHLEPVNVGGVTVSRVSVYNSNEVERLNLKKNSRVVIARRGDVIPKIEEVLKFEELNETEEEILIPKKCPVCNSEVVKVDDEVNIKCSNLDCKAKKILSIAHFTGSSGLDIKGFGINTVTDLFENNLIENIDDIFNLNEKKDKLLKLERYGNKKVDNLINEINNIKNNRFIWQIISALGIEHTGVVASKILDLNFCKDFHDRTEAEYLELDGFGTKTAIACVDFFIKNREKIEKIIKFIEPKCLKNQQQELQNNSSEIENKSDQIPLNGKKIVLTGTFNLPRKEVESRLEKFGAISVKSISSKTDFLIVASNESKESSKYKKAQKLNVTILSESDIKNYLL